MLRWTHCCLTAPSMCKGHPIGMCDSSSSPSPFCSITVPSIGTSIDVLRLTRGRLQCHVSGESNPRFASSVTAGKTGWSRRSSASSLIISLRPWMGSGGPCAVPDVGSLVVVVSSNHVGRIDLTPIALLESVFLTLSLRKRSYQPGRWGCSSTQVETHCQPYQQQIPRRMGVELRNSRASFLATTAVPEDPAEALRGGLLLTPLLGCKARTPLDWTHAWAMLGEWAGMIAFPIPAQGAEWPRHGHGIYLRPDFIHRTPPFLTWARPIFEQGALSPMAVLPSNFPILCLPGDKLFQSKDIDEAYCLPPIVHAFQGNKVRMGKKLQKWQKQGLYPLAVALLGVDLLPPLWTHPTGSDFVRGSKFVAKSHVAEQRKLTRTQVLLLQCLWTPAANVPSLQRPYTVAPRLPSRASTLRTSC